jgi:hypothetical protein
VATASTGANTRLKSTKTMSSWLRREGGVEAREDVIGGTPFFSFLDA